MIEIAKSPTHAIPARPRPTIPGRRRTGSAIRNTVLSEPALRLDNVGGGVLRPRVSRSWLSLNRLEYAHPPTTTTQSRPRGGGSPQALFQSASPDLCLPLHLPGGAYLEPYAKQPGLSHSCASEMGRRPHASKTPDPSVLPDRDLASTLQVASTPPAPLLEPRSYDPLSLRRGTARQENCLQDRSP